MKRKIYPRFFFLLKNQTYKLYEIIVVNDNSDDNTEEVAKSFGVKILSLNEEPPEGWLGKNWTIGNGYLASMGELLLFIDADGEPEKDFAEVFIKNYEKHKGLVSCWPYQRLEKFYEHLNFAFNLVSIFSINLFGKRDGAFGPAILISRNHYEKVGGHKEIKNKLVEDIALAKKCIEKNISVNNFIGGRYIKFRMYPEGLKDLFRGFTKNIAKGAFSINLLNFLFIFFYILGIYGSIFYFMNSPFNLLYPLYALQFYVIQKKLGDYEWYDALLYPLHFIFFLLVFFYSIFRIFFLKTILWKGRKIRVA